MTRKESEALKESVRYCSKAVSEAVDGEISCRSMIMSCLIYGHDSSFYDEKNDELGQYAKDYWKENPRHYSNCNFTKDELVEMFRQQKMEFQRGECGYAGNDSEGCSYNYFKYWDEIPSVAR